jgi:DnaJ-class molecular chaperone
MYSLWEKKDIPKECVMTRTKTGLCPQCGGSGGSGCSVCSVCPRCKGKGIETWIKKEQEDIIDQETE